MPLVQISLQQGRDPQRLRTLISAVTAAVAESLDTPPDTVRVILAEVPATHWAAGDVTLAERAAASAEPPVASLEPPVAPAERPVEL